MMRIDGSTRKEPPTLESLARKYMEKNELDKVELMPVPYSADKCTYRRKGSSGNAFVLEVPLPYRQAFRENRSITLSDLVKKYPQILGNAPAA